MDGRAVSAPPASSPVPPALLEPVLAEELPAARTLPPQAYTSREVFAWEQEHFFEGSWVCVGRADGLAETGDQRALRIGGEGVLLVRGDDGALIALSNVCRHRAHELLQAGMSRNATVIKCPYHAWVYDLAGQVSAAPRFHDVPGFDRSAFRLIRLRVEEWQGWIFVNASGDAPDLAEHVGNLTRLLDPWLPARLFTAARQRYTVRANWKTITENYHECYHCSSIHPELCRVTLLDSGRNVEHTGAWVGGSMRLRDHTATMSLTGESGGVAMPGLTGDQTREIHYYGLFPNLLLSMHPDYVLTHRLEPIGPDETVVECEWLFPPEARDVDGFDPTYAVEFWDLTNQQDWAACESVFRGLSSRGARQGPFTWSEDEVQLFMAMVARGYVEGGVRAPSSYGVAREPAR
jgi:Rieske 2Fe-2S family protein